MQFANYVIRKQKTKLLQDNVPGTTFKKALGLPKCIPRNQMLMSRRSRLANLALQSIIAFNLSLLFYGCAGSVNRIAGAAGGGAARAAVPAAAQSLEHLAEPDNQKKLVDLAHSPAVEDTIRLISSLVGAGATQGIFDTLQNHKPAAFHHFINDEIIVPIAQALSQQVDHSLDSAFSDSSQKKAEELIHRLMQEEIIPSIRQLLSDSAADAIKLSASPDVQPAVSANARVVSEGATAGPRDALIQLGVLNQNGQITRPIRMALWSLVALGALLAIVLIAAVVALSRLAFASRRSHDK